MADTLYTIHTIAIEPEFQARLNAGAAKENAPGDPVQWVYVRRYDLAAAPGWGAAVDSWLVANPPPDVPEDDPDYKPNGWATDQGVISDGMITAQIQSILLAEQPEPAVF